MVTRSLWFGAAIIVLVSIGHSVQAAEIGCASLYGETRLPPQFPNVKRNPEQLAQRLWPSGARPTPATCRIGFIHSEIVSGDYEKFLFFYRENHPFLEQVSLDSPGGDVHEAVKIGRLLRKYLITAVSPYPIFVDGRFVAQDQMNYTTGNSELCFEACRSLCASSCALISFGAPDRAGRIGLHRPSTTDSNFRTLAPDEAAKAYRQMLDEIVSYLEEMEAPRPAIDAMVATGSAEIRWFDFDDKSLEARAPSFSEWLDASCGRFTIEENNRLMKLSARETLRSPLYQKFQRKAECETQLISSQRDKLPPP